MLKVGLTGGIGSGKSMVAGIFETLGVPVYNSDDRAKVLMNSRPELVLQIKSVFGKEAYVDGVLNRRYIAQRVFNDKDLLSRLNAIVHPAVGQDFEQWCSENADQTYVLKEAALIFEAGIHKDLDKIILVTAPEQTRIDRVMARDGASEDAVKARIANQWTDVQKAPKSHFIINNDGSAPLLRQVLEIHNLLRG